MSEDVIFKGSRAGLELILKPEANFADILVQLRNKLETAMDFFGKGTVFHIAENRLTTEQKLAMGNLLGIYGMKLEFLHELPKIEKKLDCDEKPEADDEPLKVVEQTVRGGQEIVCRGSVIIKGNVNPGAEIVAGGDIDVRGTLRGVVHAGAFGNRLAVITADRMLAIQIRIADLIARAPDPLEKTEQVATGPERARIKDGAIVIEPMKRQEVDQ